MDDKFELENSELCVKVRIDSENSLWGFPFLSGQFYGYQEDDTTEDDMTWLIVDLAGHTDITTAQAQFLDTNQNVVDYTIR